MESAQILTVRCSTGSATLRAPVPEIAALKTRFFSIASTLLLVFALFGGPAIATARVVAPSEFVVAAAVPLMPPSDEPELVPLRPSVGWMPLR